MSSSLWIERTIYTTLDNAVTAYSVPGVFAKFLRGKGLDDAEAAKGETAFRERTPQVVHGYARADGVFPAIAIILGGESIAQDYLGEDAPSIDPDTGEVLEDQYGNPVDMHERRWQRTYNLMVMADHPDVTLYLYHWTKSIMQAARSALLAAGADQIVYSGQDLAPDNRFLPSDLFARQCSVTLQSDEEYEETSKPGIGAGRRVARAYVPQDVDADKQPGGVIPYAE